MQKLVAEKRRLEFILICSKLFLLYSQRLSTLPKVTKTDYVGVKEIKNNLIYAALPNNRLIAWVQRQEAK